MTKLTRKQLLDRLAADYLSESEKLCADIKQELAAEFENPEEMLSLLTRLHHQQGPGFTRPLIDQGGPIGLMFSKIAPKLKRLERVDVAHWNVTGDQRDLVSPLSRRRRMRQR